MAQAQERSDYEDTIDPRGKHPENAFYVARDKKSGAEVSFDSWGRKLDSLGHVVAGDRQRAGDAGAKAIRREAPQQQDVSKVFEGAPVKLTSLLTRGTPGPTRRSSWDNSVLPNQGQATARSTGALLPGGIDPATGLKAETAYNPYRNRSFPQSVAPWLEAGAGAQQAGPEVQANAWSEENRVRMPWESFQGKYESPVTRESMTAVPGVGMLPNSALPQTQGWAQRPNANMPYPPTGASMYPMNAFTRTANRNWPDDGRLPMIGGPNPRSSWTGYQNLQYDPYGPLDSDWRQAPVEDYANIPGYGRLPPWVGR
jgi:hypothetical protein